MPLPHCQHLDTKLRRKGWSSVRVRKVPAGDDNLIDGVTKRGVSLGIGESFGHEQTPCALASDGPEGSVSRIGEYAARDAPQEKSQSGIPNLQEIGRAHV